MTHKPWRQIAVPHKDVLSGTFQQAEFAADIHAVREGRAPAVYQDPRLFYARTFITSGMQRLLTQVAERLLGRGGEPVIQLQTSFGGGKTHTMLAVFHLASRTCPLSDMLGVAGLLQSAQLLDLPVAKVAVLDGTAYAPARAWPRDGLAIHTLWGELAFQLGGRDGYERVRASDESGTSPGKDILQQLLQDAGPCVVLVDELVAWVRQLVGQTKLSGGTYAANISFVQALTEAVKQVPHAVLLASLPESEKELGGPDGAEALRELERVFGRVQALWKPVDMEESFEIVRRRLFEPIVDEAGRDGVCNAFADLYRAEGSRVPSETQQARYADRLRAAYPIHPELFDRLYEDWSTLPTFQRTRGVLKLLARVIHKLWVSNDADLMILPATLPLYDSQVRGELVMHLNNGWDPVIDRDIDGEGSEAQQVDAKEARFGSVHAARRVTRTVFFATAPASVALREGVTRGVERNRLLLGCLQPGQSSAVYSDALGRLVDRLHYLNASGDRTTDSARYWFDVRANLRREMEERAAQPAITNRVRIELDKVLTQLVPAGGAFDGVHIFTPHGDVPDDGALRLVVLPHTASYNRQTPKPATHAVLTYLRENGGKPRFKSNRLLFLAADAGSTQRLLDAGARSLAWTSIVADIAAGKLNVDLFQQSQAQEEAKTAFTVLQRCCRDTYKWLLCPVQHEATAREVEVESHQLNTTATSVGNELQRLCVENELVITTWSPIHLRSRLREFFWKDDQPHVGAKEVWEAMQKYLYLPRLRSRQVFDNAVRQGASTKDFFGAAYGQDGERYLGFVLGGQVQVDDTLLLIEPSAAQQYQAKLAAIPAPTPTGPALPGQPAGPSQPLSPIGPLFPVAGGGGAPVTTPTFVPVPVVVAPKSARYWADAAVSAATAKSKLSQIADEIIAQLANDPYAEVTVTVTIEANFPQGVSENLRRAVSENGRVLGIRGDWE